MPTIPPPIRRRRRTRTTEAPPPFLFFSFFSAFFPLFLLSYDCNPNPHLVSIKGAAGTLPPQAGTRSTDAQVLMPGQLGTDAREHTHTPLTHTPHPHLSTLRIETWEPSPSIDSLVSPLLQVHRCRATRATARTGRRNCARTSINLVSALHTIVA